MLQFKTKTNRMKKIVFLLTLGLSLSAISQNKKDWAAMMQDPDANFYEIQKVFNEYWETHDKSIPGSGYKAFKRWEYFVEPRVYPSGDLKLLGNRYENFKSFIENNQTNKINTNTQLMSSTWSPIGPMGAMSGVADNGFPRKAGRDNFITFLPGSNTTFWVGAPAGGLWKTTNSGTSWTTNTDLLTIVGCTDLAIDPNNTQIMYLATGDGFAGDTPSIGVLKSTDGGLTWNTTGLSWLQSQGRRIRRLIIHPTNSQILLAATSNGIYRTLNSGTTWTQVNAANTYDIEFNPGNPNTIYACGTTYYKSVNGGTTFSSTGITGLPAATNLSRMSLAVTAADTNYVYIVAAENSTNGYGLYGFYRSTNSGVAFTTMSTTPDILSNPCSGSGTGAQGWYDLCLAASPSNKNEVVVGGVNVWRSTNGGTAWTSIGCWIGTGNPPYIHADHHSLAYNSAGTIYSTNDGGVYFYTGSAWTDITSTRNIAQIYKLGLSSLSANKLITGHQDNGSNIWNGTTYAASLAGDGMDCFIDRTNDNNLFAARPNGSYYRSTTNGASWSSITSGLSGTAGWVAPWKQDPSSATTLYAGYSQMFKSTNSGSSWSQIGTMGGSGTIVEFAVAPNNNQKIYVIRGSGVYKTTNGGTSWTGITGTLPTTSAAPTFITVSPTDADKLWITLSGYSSGNKVYQSIDGGTTWTNYSGTLPNLPANCSVYQNGSSDGIYIGMDVGVYYRNSSMSDWLFYSNGLPNAPVFDMEISTGSKLRVATYGRGVWEVDTYTAPVAVPVSNFVADNYNPCVNQNVNFSDNSSNTPTSWSWSFQNGNPSSSTSQNPTVSFTSAGTFTVSLVATNGVGAGSTYTQTITVLPLPSVTVTPTSYSMCVGTSVTFTATGGSTYAWSGTGGTNSTATYSPLFSQNYTVTAAANGCTASTVATVTVVQLPTVSVVPNNPSVCQGGVLTFTASGATTSYNWSNGGGTNSVATYTPTSSGTYTVSGNSSGCIGNPVNVNYTVNPLPTVSMNALSSPMCDIAGLQTLSATPSGGTFAGTGVSGGNFDPSVGAGSYTIYYSYTDANNCSGIDSQNVVVQSCVGIKETGQTTFWSVYPNPGNENIWVQVEDANSGFEVLICDITGRIVYERKEGKGVQKIKVDISKWPSGMYFVKLRLNGAISIKKIVKE